MLKRVKTMEACFFYCIVCVVSLNSIKICFGSFPVGKMRKEVGIKILKIFSYAN